MRHLAVRRGQDPFGGLFRQLDRDFDSLVRRSFGQGEQGFAPAANVLQEGSDLVFQVELPGIDPSEIAVDVARGRLVISGQRSAATGTDTGETAAETDAAGTENARSGARVWVSEIQTGAFRREFALPNGTGSDQVEAGYDLGVLTVRVRDAVRQPEGPTRIQINA